MSGLLQLFLMFSGWIDHGESDSQQAHQKDGVDELHQNNIGL